MTNEQWLIEFNKHKNVLMDLIKVYHPYNVQPHNVEIIAPETEIARKIVCSHISRENYPLNIEEAIRNKDTLHLRKVLCDTWFGMPESIEIRNEAFFILCNLLE